MDNFARPVLVVRFGTGFAQDSEIIWRNFHFIAMASGQQSLVHGAQSIAWHMHEQVVLDMIIDPIGGQKKPCQR